MTIREWCEQFRDRLLRYGIPTEKVSRLVKEVRAHAGALAQEEQNEGRSKDEAEQWALDRIGTVDEMVDETLTNLRNSSFFSRHPLVTVFLIPFIATPILIVGTNGLSILGLNIVQLYTEGSNVGIDYWIDEIYVLLVTAFSIYILPVLAVVFFWKIAIDNYHGLKGGLMATYFVLFHGWMTRVILEPATYGEPKSGILHLIYYEPTSVDAILTNIYYHCDTRTILPALTALTLFLLHHPITGTEEDPS